MKITVDWIEVAETQAVTQALTQAGYQALFVGGCVRDALLGVPVSDIDIATDATPEDTMACAEAAGLRAVPTGLAHGTITVISCGVPHEITTFRSDIETDGRYAQVRFSKDVSEDAARRDFTMNALYAAPDGTIVDPLGGLDDLRARHVRFIGEAAARIQEDYLRSLRFFRFTAWYGDPALGMDQDGLSAVAVNLDGLEGLSRERVGTEMKKLLTAPDPAIAVAAMRTTGVLSTVLPGADDRALGVLVHIEQQNDLAPNAIRRLALLADASDALRLSKAEKKLWTVLRDEIGSMKTAAHLGYLHGANSAMDVLALRAALFDQSVPKNAKIETKKGETAKFPVKAKDLANSYKGADLGRKLKELEARWIASDFELSKEELLS